MSKESKINTLKATFDNLKSLNINQFFENPGAYNDWEGLNISEFRQELNYVLDTFNKAFELDVFNELSFNVINSLINQLNSFRQHLTNLINQKNQPMFQNACNQLDALTNLIFSFGIHHLVYSGKEFQDTQKQMELALSRLTQGNNEIDLLKSNVQNLIEPAVSGSLSKSFSDRAEFLFRSRRIWAIISIFTGALMIGTTWYAVQELISDIYEKNSLAANKELFIPIIILRFIILIPVYGAFVFVFGQYKKERDLEEEYAHRAAVATSLPNYGDLARENNVRDQIVSAATTVIFTSPSKANTDQSKTKKDMDIVNNLINSISKLVTTVKG